MPTFYLIDHSLKTTGGHHFDYATRMANVAESRGYQIVIAANRKFRSGLGKLLKGVKHRSFPASWSLCCPFRFHMYSDYCAHNGWDRGAIGFDGEMLPSLGAFDQGKGKKSGSQESDGSSAGSPDPTYPDRRRRIDNFAASCEQLFRKHPPASDDLVFFPSMTEFDVIGLAKFLRRAPWSRDVPIHVQLHFGMCEGREYEYSEHQSVFENVGQQLRHALSDLAEHRLSFYATTERLARQFDQLGVRRFFPLPYPVNELLHESEAKNGANVSEEQPLRIACAGAVRAEKGQQYLTTLVNELWDEWFQNGKVQLAIQCKPTRIGRRPRQVVELPSGASFRKRERPRFRRPSETCTDRIVHCRHPLPEHEYRAFIQSTDIGLLMYDARRYYARHAGIMGEFLSCGIPVIVPAGCWLSDQLEPSIQQHRRSLWWDEPSSASEFTLTRSPKLAGRASNESSTEERLWTEIGLPHTTKQFLTQVQGAIERGPQLHLRCEAEFLDRESKPVGRSVEIVSTQENSTLLLAFNKPQNADIVRLKFSSAFDPRQPVIERLRLKALTPNDIQPVGRVGLVVPSVEALPFAAREIAKHFEHYRNTAAEFAATWDASHHPSQTIDKLLQAEAAASIDEHAA